MYDVTDGIMFDYDEAEYGSVICESKNYVDKWVCIWSDEVENLMSMCLISPNGYVGGNSPMIICEYGHTMISIGLNIWNFCLICVYRKFFVYTTHTSYMLGRDDVRSTLKSVHSIQKTRKLITA